MSIVKKFFLKALRLFRKNQSIPDKTDERWISFYVETQKILKCSPRRPVSDIILSVRESNPQASKESGSASQ